MLNRHESYAYCASHTKRTRRFLTILMRYSLKQLDEMIRVSRVDNDAPAQRNHTLPITKLIFKGK